MTTKVTTFFQQLLNLPRYIVAFIKQIPRFFRRNSGKILKWFLVIFMLIGIFGTPVYVIATLIIQALQGYPI